MSSIDIRNKDGEEVTEIVFAEEYDDFDTIIAYKLTKENDRINIHDNEENVVITTKEHAQNLIKALNKAIELGWVK